MLAGCAPNTLRLHTHTHTLLPPAASDDCACLWLRVWANSDTQAPVRRAQLLEELRRDPLWQFSSMGPQRPRGGAAWKQLTASEAEGALLAYVRLAADAEQRQQDDRGVASGRRQLLPADVAADLQALYALAAMHAAHQQHPAVEHEQQQQQSRSSSSSSSRAPARRRGPLLHSLSETEFLELLQAYACLGDGEAAAGQPASGGWSSSRAGAGGSSSSMADPHGHTAAADTLHALCALARLAETAHEDSRQQHVGAATVMGAPHPQAEQAPGQLRKGSNNSAAQAASPDAKHPLGRPGISSSNSSASREASQDVGVLLQLAQQLTLPHS